LQAELGKAGTEADALRRAKQDAEDRAKKYREVFEKLKKLKDLNLQVSIRHQQIIISLPGDVLFAKGSEFLSTEGKAVVMKVANLIKSDADLSKRFYQVIGHTDNEPYVGNYKDNVGLSLMRAREVYQFLTTPNPNPKGQPGGGLDPQLWTAAGYGDQDPLEGTRDRQSPDQAKKNRRVEIAVLLDASQLLGLDQLEQESK
jgi:chemotaxis protein MotB